MLIYNLTKNGSQGPPSPPAYPRISVSDERVHFPHRGNSNNVLVEEDPTLGRQIVTIRDICWLEIGHTFSVTPCTYSVSLRLRVNPEVFRWPHNDKEPTTFSLSYPLPSGDQWSTSVNVYSNWWNALKRPWTSPLPDIEGLSVNFEEARPEERSGWVTVILGPVMVTQDSLVFRMRDVECPHWKSGISFDFLQLIRHYQR